MNAKIFVVVITDKDTRILLELTYNFDTFIGNPLITISQKYGIRIFSLFLKGLVNAGCKSSMIAYGLSADHRNYQNLREAI